MSLPLTLPARFPLVGLGIVSAVVLNMWQGHNVMNARKYANVQYPTMYASEESAASDAKKKQFNCTQRAHQNTLESLSGILALTVYLGIFQPELATASIMTWVFGKIFYTLNYSRGNPANRNNGLALTAYLGLAGLFFGSGYHGVVAALKLIQ